MPRGGSKAKFYGVARGREPGVYSTWDEASAQVTGIKGAVHKSFGTEAEAEAWVAAQRGGDPGGDSRPSESARLRSPATSPIQPRARPSSSARLGPTSPPPARRAMSTIAGFADAENAAPSAAPTISADKRYLLAFDGACRGNPGPSGAGAVIKEITKIPASRESRESRESRDVSRAGAVVFELASYLGDALTNNESEYLALIAGLRAASELGCADVQVIGDSKLVINQVNNVWQVKKPNLVPLWREAQEVIASAPFKDRLSMTHVERERNAEADALANAAIELGRSRGEGVNVARGYVRPSRDVTVSEAETESVTGAETGTVAAEARLRRRRRRREGARRRFLRERRRASLVDEARAFRRFLTRDDGRVRVVARRVVRATGASERGKRVEPTNRGFRGSVSPGRKRAFPSVSSVAPTASEGEAFGSDAKASRRSAERVDRNAKESKSASPAPDPAMFASMTVSRMRRAEVNRLAPGLLRAARFFV
jgi:ribonuclease HI